MEMTLFNYTVIMLKDTCFHVQTFLRIFVTIKIKIKTFKVKFEFLWYENPYN